MSASERSAPCSNALPHIVKNRTQGRSRGTLGLSKSSAFRIGKPALIKSVELLIKDQEIANLDFLLATGGAK